MAEKATVSTLYQLGFVRVLAQARAYGLQGGASLHTCSSSRHDPLVSPSPYDDCDVAQLPGWVKAPKQITDGHLSRLPSAHGSVLLTRETSKE